MTKNNAISIALIKWFKHNKRTLPWREKPHWYKTFLSEIILQQTTVEQGLPYFSKFLADYPTIEHLSKASEEEVLLKWSGLGYYARARNMLKAAGQLQNIHNGQFPQNYKQALALPGIGPYSAAAILSIAFNQPFAVVDGNVIRVLSRLFYIKEDTRLKATLNKISAHAQQILSLKQPGQHNEALMELGALICSPLTPQCKICPLSAWCKTGKKGETERIPYKSKAKPKQKKYNLVCIVVHNNKIALMKRPPNGLLASMWEFPVYEATESEFNKRDWLVAASHYALPAAVNTYGKKLKHIYSHIDLSYDFALYIAEDVKQHSYKKTKWVTTEELENMALNHAHKKALKWLRLIIKP